ncbi:hypothetical protein EHM69_01835 [candidate division KSB1 bacterium]|nr:MAG: hypothetical protein EHM69_01835 [candidate division KSB1 bacterium]
MKNLFKNLWIRKHRIVLAIILAVLIVLFIMYRTIDNPPPPQEEINLNSTSDSAAQSEVFILGKHLALKNCARCHGSDLHGGAVPGDSGEVALAANITRSGVCSTYTEKDFIRVLHEGKHPDGSPVSPVMLAIESRNMSDDEVHAVYLYARSLPPHP